MSKIILFDFDHTLFDTDAFFHQQLKPALLELLGCDLSQLDSAEAAYVASLNEPMDYSLEGYAESFAEYFSVDQTKLEKILFNPEFYKAAVFSDAVTVLESLSRTHDLGLFTQGNIEFQLQKIRLCGLKPWFEETLCFVTKNKIASEFVSQLPSNAVIIDDKKEILESLASHTEKKFKLFLINRKSEIIQNEHFNTVKSLTDFSQKLQNNV